MVKISQISFKFFIFEDISLLLTAFVIKYTLVSKCVNIVLHLEIYFLSNLCF